MNPNQLSTLVQAMVTAIQMDAHNIGGGVTDIYNIPNPQGSPDFRHYRFANGAEGINAGLCRTTIQNNPDTWAKMLTDDVNNAAPKS